MNKIFMGKFPQLDKPVARIVLIYLVFGLMWIFYSDSVLESITSSREQFVRLSLYKGWAYMVITSVLLYILVKKTLQYKISIEQSLKLSEDRWKFSLEGSGDGVWDWNLETGEVFRSPRWHQMYGYSPNEIASNAEAGRVLIHPDDLSGAIDDLDALRSGLKASFITEFRILCKEGSWKWVLSRGMIISFTPEGKPLRIIGTHTDISERKNSEAELFRLAHYDSVTGLPNRVLFLDRFDQEIKKAKRTGQPVALLYLDLDGFKEINDTLGHDIGDFLLKEVANRLVNCVRATDTVARLGGDEFTIILTDLNELDSVENIAQDILNKIADPFKLRNEIVYITTSMGITFYPEDASDAETLLKNSDQAMYAAKDEGRNRYYYFRPAMQHAAMARMRVANDLHVALDAGQFKVYYQPIVELATGKINKAEALIRWTHPIYGFVGPMEFIPIAENTGMIVEIGDFVFSQVVSQLSVWRQRNSDFQISVNKSPIQFKNSNRPHLNWTDHLQSMGLPGDSIVIEITEGLLLDANGPIVKQLIDYHEEGIEIAIDDFGTGYSSLAYLKKFEIDYVKIDQSFTRNIVVGSDDLALCEAIIVMSHKLGIKVIAEGIETQEQHDLLVLAGCDYGQGYLFSRAIPAGEFELLDW